MFYSYIITCKLASRGHELLHDFVWTDLSWPNSWKLACAIMRIITYPLIFARFHWLLYVTCKTVITQSLLFYIKEKRPSFVNSSDSDIRKPFSNVVFRNYKEMNKIRTRKLKSTKYFGALEEVISHHNWSSFGLITVEIKLNRSN